MGRLVEEAGMGKADGEGRGEPKLDGGKEGGQRREREY